MILRWVAYVKPSGGFRAVRGFRDIKVLVMMLTQRVQKPPQRADA